jgi:hypothetical protein
MMNCLVSNKYRFIITPYLNSQKCNHSMLYVQPLDPSMYRLNLRVIGGWQAPRIIGRSIDVVNKNEGQLIL